MSFIIDSTLTCFTSTGKRSISIKLTPGMTLKIWYTNTDQYLHDYISPPDFNNKFGIQDHNILALELFSASRTRILGASPTTGYVLNTDINQREIIMDVSVIISIIYAIHALYPLNIIHNKP